MSTWYKLVDRKPVPINDVREAEAILKSRDRIVALNMVGDVKISTVFLVLNHGYVEGEDPVLFETMIFNGEHDGDQWRYNTYEQALEGHAAALELVGGPLRAAVAEAIK